MNVDLSSMRQVLSLRPEPLETGERLRASLPIKKEWVLCLRNLVGEIRWRKSLFLPNHP